MNETQTHEATLARAREMGEDHGRAAASWYFDGNTTDDTYAAVLQGIEDGDPMILDTFPAAPLSGEWADEPTPATVLADLLGSAAWDMYATDEQADEYLCAYEDGFYEASARAIEETARKMVSA